MRLAGYNANQVGLEPMNGMGIYTAADSLSSQWTITQTISAPATASAAWDLRQFAAASASFAWGIRAFVAATKAAAWDLRQFASNSVAAVWDDAQGVIAFISAKWRVPFSPHAGSALSRSGGSSSLTPHTATSSLSEH